MRSILRLLWERATTSFWLWPVLITLSSIAGALLAISADRQWADVFRAPATVGLLFGGSPAGARTALSTIAGAMITIAALVFSTTMIALTLASNQLGPRVMRVFMADRGTQMSLGVFIGTFAYCLVGLGAVDDTAAARFVPRLTVSGAFVLALTGLGVLIYFLHHVARAIQAPVAIASVAADLDRSVARRSRTGPDQPGPRVRPVDVSASDDLVVAATRKGYVQIVDAEALAAVACAHDVEVRVSCRAGDFVFPGVPLARLRLPAGEAPAADSRRIAHDVAGAIAVGEERTPVQDLAFQFDQLIEIGIRALSPGINDPITCLSCLHQCTAALAAIAAQPEPGRIVRDSTGRARVFLRERDFEDFAGLVFNGLRTYGAGSRLVVLALLDALGQLARTVAPAWRPCLDDHAERIVADARRRIDNEADLRDITAALAETRARLGGGARSRAVS
ncbi:MAG: DUF2254 domain-containing protein [Vicinamibacterales bacterium]